MISSYTSYPVNPFRSIPSGFCKEVASRLSPNWCICSAEMINSMSSLNTCMRLFVVSHNNHPCSILGWISPNKNLYALNSYEYKVESHLERSNPPTIFDSNFRQSFTRNSAALNLFGCVFQHTPMATVTGWIPTQRRRWSFGFGVVKRFGKMKRQWLCVPWNGSCHDLTQKGPDSTLTYLGGLKDQKMDVKDHWMVVTPMGAIKPFDKNANNLGGWFRTFFESTYIYPGFNLTKLPSKLQHFLLPWGIKHGFLICDAAKCQKQCWISLLILSIFTAFELFVLG